jgi:hypothetical protein
MRIESIREYLKHRFPAIDPISVLPAIRGDFDEVRKREVD